jgi:hypothetical protein
MDGEALTTVVESLMIMSARLRKFALTVHVISSVGWLGAVTSFLLSPLRA